MELALAENADLRQQIAALRQRSDRGDGRIHQAVAARLAPRTGVSGFLDPPLDRQAPRCRLSRPDRLVDSGRNLSRFCTLRVAMLAYDTERESSR